MTRRAVMSKLAAAAAMIAAAAISAPALAQQVVAPSEAYCYIRDVKINRLRNGVQILVKADGVLSFQYPQKYLERAAQRGWQITEIRVLFPQARLAIDKTEYAVDTVPVSTVTLAVPQGAREGLGVIMTVSLTEPAHFTANRSEDMQTFILTVYAKRTVEGVKRGAPAGAMKTGEMEVTAHNGRLSVRALRADIHKLVAEIARASGINVTVDDAVRHKVSINVENAQPLEVLRAIAAAYGLALSEVEDVWMLSEGVPTDLPTYHRSATASFPVKYLKASDAVSLLPTFLFRYVHDNPQQNAVVATAPSQMLDKIRRDLKAIDIPPPMIMIECLAVEVTDTRELEAQLRWHYESRRYGTSGDTGTGEVNFEHVDGIATAIADTPALQVWLKAMLSRGKAVIRANPRMAAVNGKTATLFIGIQRFIKMQYIRYGQQYERIEMVPVGVRLTVRPWTGGNREITTWLSMEVSNIVEIDQETGLPRLSTRRASTTVRTRDGETIVIGGLIQRQEERVHRRIPILGSLPIIGPLFRSQSTNYVNTQLMIFVRPRLLDELGRLPDQQEELRIREKFLRPGDLGYPAKQKPQPQAQ